MFLSPKRSVSVKESKQGFGIFQADVGATGASKSESASNHQGTVSYDYK
jgi:hypothetical protein